MHKHNPVECQNEEEVDDVDPIENVEVQIDAEEDTPSTFVAVKEELRTIEPSTSETPEEATKMVVKNTKKLGTVSHDEGLYRKKQYKIMSAVLRKRLHCTICDAHVGCSLDLKKDDIEHPLLRVLACPKCTFTYKYIDFPLTPEGKDVRCRWCTKPASEDAPLRYCQHCPFAFCEMCIYCNLPLDELASNKGTWKCVVCNLKELWPQRAVLWALLAQIQFNKSRCLDDRWKGDVSQCCKVEKKAVPKMEVDEKPKGLTINKNIINPTIIHNNGYQPRRGRGRGRVSTIRPILLNAQQHHQVGMKTMPTIRPIYNVMSRSTYKMEPSKMMAQTSLTPGLEKSKPLPATKFETFWLKGRIEAITTTIETLNSNLNRVSNGVPEVDDKFNIKSKMISLTSLLNIGANQISSCTKEMENDWDKVLEVRGQKIGNDVLTKSDLRYPLDSDFDAEFYLDKFKIKPCSVKLVKLEDQVISDEDVMKEMNISNDVEMVSIEEEPKIEQPPNTEMRLKILKPCEIESIDITD